MFGVFTQRFWTFTFGLVSPCCCSCCSFSTSHRHRSMLLLPLLFVQKTNFSCVFGSSSHIPLFHQKMEAGRMLQCCINIFPFLQNLDNATSPPSSIARLSRARLLSHYLQCMNFETSDMCFISFAGRRALDVCDSHQKASLNSVQFIPN